MPGIATVQGTSGAVVRRRRRRSCIVSALIATPSSPGLGARLHHDGTVRRRRGASTSSCSARPLPASPSGGAQQSFPPPACAEIWWGRIDVAASTSGPCVQGCSQRLPPEAVAPCAHDPARGGRRPQRASAAIATPEALADSWPTAHFFSVRRSVSPKGRAVGGARAHGSSWSPPACGDPPRCAPRPTPAPRRSRSRRATPPTGARAARPSRRRRSAVVAPGPAAARPPGPPPCVLGSPSALHAALRMHAPCALGARPPLGARRLRCLCVCVCGLTSLSGPAIQGDIPRLSLCSLCIRAPALRRRGLR